MKHSPSKTVLGVAIAVGSLGFAIAGCGSVQTASPRASYELSATSSEPAAWPTEGSSPARLAGDGRYFGLVRAASEDPPTISFDVAQFFYGKSVQKAAEEDGAVKPGEPVSNDHYERNPDTEARTLKVANDARVTAAGGHPDTHASRGANALPVRMQLGDPGKPG
jgi:hypothetical protein